ncbi:MAG: PAS domain-containing sensor histidine kinase [Polyangiaceae bacterium]|nr:PAS domain-containing sensor histidine kinase [Polyangiaceae bacterium]
MRKDLRPDDDDLRSEEPRASVDEEHRPSRAPADAIREIAELLTDPLGVLGEANEAAEALFGIDGTSLLARPLASFIPAEERAAFRAFIARLRAVGHGESVFRLLHRSGLATPVRLGGVALPDSGLLSWTAKPLSISGIYTVDPRSGMSMTRPTSPRAAEALATELSARSRATLATMDTFRAGSPTHEQQMRLFDRLEQDLVAQSAIVEVLVERARRIHIERRSIDLGELAFRAFDAIRPYAAHRRVTLRLKSAGIAPIEADEARIHHVLTSLLADAVGVAGAGATVAISVHASNTRALMSIETIAPRSDPSDTRNWVREQKQQTMTDVTLLVANSVVELHGGRFFALEFGAGKQRSFLIELPRNDNED